MPGRATCQSQVFSGASGAGSAAAGHTGESAVWLFTVDAEGQLAAANGRASKVAMSAYKNELERQNGVPGFDRGGSDAIGTDRQRVRWSAVRNDLRSIDDQVTFAVPVTLGQSLVWGVFGTGRSSTASFGSVSLPSTAEADFLHTLRYGGSGIDWTIAAQKGPARRRQARSGRVRPPATP